MRTPPDLRNEELYKFIQEQGFVKFGLFDYDLGLRIHTQCHLLWSDNFAHFALGVFYPKRKGQERTRWEIVLIPVPVYTKEKAFEIIRAVTVPDK